MGIHRAAGGAVALLMLRAWRVSGSATGSQPNGGACAAGAARELARSSGDRSQASNEIATGEFGEHWRVSAVGLAGGNRHPLPLGDRGAALIDSGKNRRVWARGGRNSS